MRNANPRVFRAALGAGLVLGGSGSGCTWDSWVPKGRPQPLPPTAAGESTAVTLCEPQTATLDCNAESECNRWYRVPVRESGEMRIQLVLGDVKGESALTRLLVRPIGKPILQQRMSTFGEPLWIATPVEPDLYGVLVQGAGGYRRFELLVAVVPPGAPPGSGCPQFAVPPPGLRAPANDAEGPRTDDP